MESLTKKRSANSMTPEEFVERFSGVVVDLTVLADDLVASIDGDRNYKKRLADLGVNAEVVDRLERLGRKQFDKRLVLSASPEVGRLKVLALSEQAQVLDEGYEVLDLDEQTVRRIPFGMLTSMQRIQVFKRDGVRTVAEQRSVIRERKAKVAPVQVAGRDARDVRFKRGEVFIPGFRWVMKSEILGWLQQI